MQGETREKWKVLCEQAAVEQDQVKLMQLIQEITSLLDEKEKRLQKQNGNGKERSTVGP